MLSRSKKENQAAGDPGKVTLIDQQVIQQDWNDREFIEVSFEGNAFVRHFSFELVR